MMKMKSLWCFCLTAPSDGCIPLLPPGGAKASKMEALTFVSQLPLFKLELQQKQAFFFCRCLFSLMPLKHVDNLESSWTPTPWAPQNCTHTVFVWSENKFSNTT